MHKYIYIYIYIYSGDLPRRKPTEEATPMGSAAETKRNKNIEPETLSSFGFQRGGLNQARNPFEFHKGWFEQNPKLFRVSGGGLNQT